MYTLTWFSVKEFFLNSRWLFEIGLDWLKLNSLGMPWKNENYFFTRIIAGLTVFFSESNLWKFIDCTAKNFKNFCNSMESKKRISTKAIKILFFSSQFPRLKKFTDDLNLIREWKNFIVGQATRAMSERMRERIKQARCVSLR